MKIKINKKIESRIGLLIVPVFKENLNKLPSSYPKAISNLIQKLVKNKEFKAKNSEMVSTYLDDKNFPEKALIIGVGSNKRFNIRAAKELGGNIGKYIKTAKKKEATVIIPKEILPLAFELVEGMLLMQYEFNKFKTKGKKDKISLEKIDIVVEEESKELAKRIERAQIFSSTIDYVKDLINSPSNIVDSEYFAAEANKVAKKNNYKIVILNNKDLTKLKWGALLAVNRESHKEAKCVAIQYEGAANKREKPIVLIGKGITFDSGGYNLKPSNYIEEMHQDMAGGATVLGIFDLLRKLNIKKNVIGIIPLAENLIGANAYRPSDIITSFSGLTIEITNTDAEGRLILADAITYGLKFDPEAIITIATLTGSVISALGDRYAGLIGNSVSLRKSLEKAGKETDDLGWGLPLHRDHKKKMDSKIADVRNCDNETAKYAGASKGAAFLERFVKKNKWCHIDIAGTAFIDDPKPYQTKGATASGLEMLVKFLES